jgi:PKHD-type hydroxylase
MHDPYSLVSRPFLTADECDNIITTHDKDLGFIEQSVYRKVHIKEIDLNSIPRLADLLNDANNQIFHLDVNGETECYFARYETGDHYDKLHIDSLPEETTRKISFSLFLNDEFEGGHFEMLGEKLAYEHLNTTRKGKLCVFPSFLPHRVTTVTSGTRYVIFGFLLGPRLK